MKTLIILLLLSSCASSYEDRTEFNVHACVHMCASGNVLQIQAFGCTCNTQPRTSATPNHNRNSNTVNGNTTVIYNTPPQPQNSPSQLNLLQTLGQGWIQSSKDYQNATQIRTNYTTPQPTTQQPYIYVPQQTQWENNN